MNGAGGYGQRNGIDPGGDIFREPLGFETVQSAPQDIKGKPGFTEIWRKDISRYSRGVLFVNANSFPTPQQLQAVIAIEDADPVVVIANNWWYADIEIVGLITSYENIIMRGPVNMDTGALRFAFDVGDSFENVAVRARSRVNGAFVIEELPVADPPVIIPNPATPRLEVFITGRLWR